MIRLRNISLTALFVFCTYIANAQLRFVAWTQSYMYVSSYLGKVSDERFNSFQFEIHGRNVQINDWSLSVRVMGPIVTKDGTVNRSGKTFPEDKLRLRWTIDDSNMETNFNSIGLNRNDILLQNANEVLLIDRSKSAISSNNRDYTSFKLFSAMIVAQGKYLDDYLGVDQWSHVKYHVPLLFTLYDGQGKVLSTQQLNYELHFPPNLTDGNLVDVEPDYSLQIATEANDASLTFLTAQDYLTGVSLTHKNGVKVNAATDFELRIKAMDADFVSEHGHTLPLSIMTIKLTEGQGAKLIKYNPNIQLSPIETLALSGSSTEKKQAQYFDINYKVSLSESQILSTKTGVYSVSVLYQLLPK